MVHGTLRWGAIAAAVILSGSTRNADAHAAASHGVELLVTAEPAPVAVGDRLRLAYELHVTNSTSRELALMRLHVLGAGRTLGTFADAALEALVGHVGRRGGAGRPRTLDPGQRAVVHVDLEVQPGTPGPGIRHELDVEWTGGGEVERERYQVGSGRDHPWSLGRAARRGGRASPSAAAPPPVARSPPCSRPAPAAP